MLGVLVFVPVPCHEKFASIDFDPFLILYSRIIAVRLWAFAMSVPWNSLSRVSMISAFVIFM
jgi:hypothetical protein